MERERGAWGATLPVEEVAEDGSVLAGSREVGCGWGREREKRKEREI